MTVSPLISKFTLATLALLLIGCGGRPKPSEDDLKNALSAAFADQPYQVAEVDFTRRDITGESAAITFEVEFRHAFDLYDRESLGEAFRKLGKPTEALDASDAWNEIRPQPAYERVREKAGVPADAAPTNFPSHVLRRVVQAGETHRTKGQVRANWDGFKWVWSDDQLEQKPSKKGGKKRGEFADDLPVITSDAELLALHEKAERDLATFLKLAAAAEAIETETLAAFATTLRPGLILGGEAIMKLDGGQRVPETWTLEIQGVDPQQRRFTALLRGDAPWELARAINGGWSYKLADPGVRLTVQSPRDAAVKNGGPFLSAARDQTFNLYVTDEGWKMDTDALRVIFTPLDAEAVAARQKAVRAEADALWEKLQPGTTWQAVLRHSNKVEEYDLRVEGKDAATGLVRMAFAPVGSGDFRREFTGMIEPNRYVHEGWPLKINSPLQRALSNTRAKNLGEWITYRSRSAQLRLDDGELEIKSTRDEGVWSIAALDRDGVRAREQSATAEAEALWSMLAPGASWRAVRRTSRATEEYELRVESTDASSGLVRVSLASADMGQFRRIFTGTLEANRVVHQGWPLQISSPIDQRIADRNARSAGEWVINSSRLVSLRATDGSLEMKSNQETWSLAPLSAGQASTNPTPFPANSSQTTSLRTPLQPQANDPRPTPTGSTALPADWDGLTPVLEIDGERQDAFAATIKINQSPMDILRGSASIQLTETRALPVLPASGWRVLMGGEGVRKTGLDGPTLSRFDTKKILRLEKTTAGFAAIPAAARLPLSITQASPGAWFSPRQPLPPGTYALLIDTTCFAFEVR